MSFPVRGRARPTLLLFAACWLALNQLAQSAVVRPTIFSDLNSSADQAQPALAQLPPSSSSPLPAAAPTLEAANKNLQIFPYKSRFCTALSGARLDEPLGMQSLAIDDLALSASSHSNEQVGPHLARLNQDILGGAWCPMKPISHSNFGKEWIQVKLNRSYVISAIETQGRFGMGSGKEFVPSYQVEYSRNGGKSWHKWKDFRGSGLLTANEDAQSAVKKELSPPIVGANVIRILPYSVHLRTVCLRFELHGCPYDDGAPVAYATSEGVVEPRWGHLIDYTYDGLRRQGQLSQGLGQLVDGVKGPDNFINNNGFEWVGWKSMNGDVLIEFTFKTLRNFTGALFHSNNLFSAGVEVFQAVDVHFGVDVGLSLEALKDAQAEQRRRDAISRSAAQAPGPAGSPDGHQAAAAQTLWSPDVVSIEYEPDKKLETSRPVTVHLKQRLANKLKFVLKFASKWILVSEVEFLSHPVELLSFSDLADPNMRPLMGALMPAKSYDEYVAILREHQLRRIVTSAYMESMGASGSSADQADGQPSREQPAASEPDAEQEFLAGMRRLNGPTLPTSGVSWQQASQGALPALPAAPVEPPASNPLLNQPQLMFGPPSVFVGNSQADGSQALPSPGESAEGAADTRPAAPRKLSTGAALSFILVSILVLIGLVLALSSYRYRNAAKGAGAHTSALARHLQGSGKLGSSGLPFMSVFNNSAASSQTTSTSVGSSANNHYNPLFASAYGAPSARNQEHTPRALESIRRGLATLTGGNLDQQNKSTVDQNGFMHSLPAHQLLVSLKDQQQQPKSKQQQVSTQLIVGLNQANPLAQQQIYNSVNCSAANLGQQLYSMSLASSSSVANQPHALADYADYAIPDVQSPAMVQQQAAYNGSSPLVAPRFGYQTELRPRQQGLALVGQQQARLAHADQHNYELVYQDQPAGGAPIFQQHQRTLSANQAAAFRQPVSSMTLINTSGRPSLLDGRNTRLLLPAGQEECSPGGSSQTSSGIATCSSSQNQPVGSEQVSSHYYYATNSSDNDK